MRRIKIKQDIWKTLHKRGSRYVCSRDWREFVKRFGKETVDVFLSFSLFVSLFLFLSRLRNNVIEKRDQVKQKKETEKCYMIVEKFDNGRLDKSSRDYLAISSNN